MNANQGEPGDLVSSHERRSRRRWDWLFLPLLSVFTIMGLVVFGDVLQQRAFRAQDHSWASCVVFDPSLNSLRGIPNSTCLYKHPEFPILEYKFNRCGDYANQDCGPKPANTYRIVMIGSSFAMGLGVEKSQTFASLLPAEITKRTQKRVELYNMSMLWQVPRVVNRRFPEVLAKGPDLVLWAITPWDLEKDTQLLPDEIRTILPKEGENESRTAGKGLSFLISHFIAKSKSHYLRSITEGDDDTVGYLRASLSTKWTMRLDSLDTDLKQVVFQAKAAGVPLAVTLLPNRPTSALVSTTELPPGFAPYNLDAQLRRMVQRDGGIYVEILPGLRSIPDPEQNYFPLDGHPDKRGHLVLADLLADGLTQGEFPPLDTVSR